MTTPGVDFFRIDRSKRTRSLLFFAGTFVTLGSLSIGAHLVHRLPNDLAHTIALGGGIVTLIGLVTGFGTMALMLFEDVYLAIKEEGVLVHVNGTDRLFAWDDLATVNVDDAGGLVLRDKGGESLSFHAGEAARTIAERVEAASRRAAHGLRPSSRPSS